jgi:hypothetical protein
MLALVSHRPEAAPDASCATENLCLPALVGDGAGLAGLLQRVREAAGMVLAGAGLSVPVRAARPLSAGSGWLGRCALRDAAAAVRDDGRAALAARLVEHCDFLLMAVRGGDAEGAARAGLALAVDHAQLSNLLEPSAVTEKAPAALRRAGRTVKAEVVRMLELRERAQPGSARARDAARSVARLVGTTPDVVRRYRREWERSAG